MMTPVTGRHLFLTLTAGLTLLVLFNGAVSHNRTAHLSSPQQQIAVSGSATPFWVATPSITTTETKREVKVTALLPSTDLKNVSVRVQDDALILSTNEEQPEIIHQDGEIGEQSSLSSFQVSIPLPARVNAHQMKTIVQQGSLTVVIPKV